jgi:hypothetical protein
MGENSLISLAGTGIPAASTMKSQFPLPLEALMKNKTSR